MVTFLTLDSQSEFSPSVLYPSLFCDFESTVLSLSTLSDAPYLMHLRTLSHPGSVLLSRSQETCC